MKKVYIIGAGPAGIEAASVLKELNVDVTIVEKSSSALKNVADKAFLFPNFASATEMANAFSKKLVEQNIPVMYDTDIVDLRQQDDRTWRLLDRQGHSTHADAVLVATGYTPFNAARKEELGYGIYPGVHTSLEMEQMIKHQNITNSMGESPTRIAFLQCVGSRDEKMGNHYCSKICCVTAVKQAIEVRKLLPQAEIYVFYMDLRMWGQHFEELYRQSQEEYNIRFVRGRISEAGGTFDGRVQIKAEDTLMGLPMKMTTDLLVLMVGMEASEGTTCIARSTGLCGDYGFIRSLDPHLNDSRTERPNLYVAGSCKRPMSLTDVVCDARSTAYTLWNDLFDATAKAALHASRKKILSAVHEDLQERREQRHEHREERREQRQTDRQLRQEYWQERREEQGKE